MSNGVFSVGVTLRGDKSLAPEIQKRISGAKLLWIVASDSRNYIRMCRSVVDGSSIAELQAYRA